MSTPTSGADTVEQILALSRADGCLAIVTHSSTVDLRWAGNTLTTNGASRDRSITVISVVGEGVGVRSASVLDDLEALVRASEQAARDAGPAEDAGPLVQGSVDSDFSEPAETGSMAALSSLAEGLGDRFAAARSDGLKLYGYATHDVTTTWLGSSTGLRKRHSQPTGYVELTGKGAAPGSSSWIGRHTRDWSDIELPTLDAELRQRLRWAERTVELPAGRYETILPPTAVADLMVYLYWTASGRDAAEGRTVFSRPGGATRLGERIAPSGLSLTSDPHDRAFPVLPFVVAGSSSSTSSVFDNGLDLQATDWLRDGQLTSLITTRASAATAGGVVTPAIDNLVMAGDGAASLDEMVAATGRGLLLTSLWYIREVDAETLLLTGLTRDGVYLVEDGEVVGAVNNFRFNESPVDLLGRASEVGRSEATLPREWSDYFTWVRMPALRIPDFNMSSVSQAS